MTRLQPRLHRRDLRRPSPLRGHLDTSAHSRRHAVAHVSLHPAAEPHALYNASKRVLDVLGAALLGLAFVPIIAVAATAVAATGRSNPFYVQRRVGLSGAPFAMLKIRTMRAGADQEVPLELNEASGPTFKSRNDPRITPLGRILRRTSIDEMPQVLNILRGEMSLVGPRPPLPDEVASYTRPQLERLSVKPGLTCIWQVSGRSDIQFREWVAMDRLYVRRRSLALDLALLARTPFAVLTMRGAR